MVHKVQKHKPSLCSTIECAPRLHSFQRFYGPLLIQGSHYIIWLWERGKIVFVQQWVSPQVASYSQPLLIKVEIVVSVGPFWVPVFNWRFLNLQYLSSCFHHSHRLNLPKGSSQWCGMIFLKINRILESHSKFALNLLSESLLLYAIWSRRRMGVF